MSIGLHFVFTRPKESESIESHRVYKFARLLAKGLFQT